MPKNFIQTLLAIIGSIFTGFVSEAKKTFKNLPQETQDALVHGSGIFDLINSMLNEVPGAIREAIQTKYPDLNIIATETSLYSIAKSLGLSPKSTNLEDSIAVLQSYLKAKVEAGGTFWADASRSLSSLLAVLLAPKGTKYEAIASLIGTVYHWLIKNKSK